MTDIQYKQVQKTVNEMKELGYTTQFDTELEYCSDHLSKETINIRFCKWADGFETTDVKIPKKKPYTTEYVLERIAKSNNRAYTNYIEVFKKLLTHININKHMTATSYGIGLESLFSSHEGMHNDGDLLKSEMDELGVAYTWDVSDATWVYRIKVSKSQKNIELIKSL